MRTLAEIVLAKVEAKPGIQAKDLPLNQRGQLRKLEQLGVIVYRDGWHPKSTENHEPATETQEV